MAVRGVHNFLRLTHVRKALVTANMVTLVRLLSSVGSVVDSQSTLLNKTFPAFSEGTLVRSLVRVNPVMSLQVRFAIEALFSC